MSAHSFSRAGLGALALFAAASAWAESTPITLDGFLQLDRVSDPRLSPDGSRLAFVVTRVLKEENRTDADLWLVDLGRGGAPRRLTASPKADRQPRWSPDGKWLAFESTRDGTVQIYLLPADGGEARRLTTLSTGASQPVWSPDGRSLAFVSSVYPQFSDKPFAEADRLNREETERRETSKVKARVIDSLLYRHWDSWVEGKRQHVFAIGVNPDGSPAGEPRNLTPGENDGVPTSSTFSGGDEFAFSPDGKELVFTAPPLPVREQAWRTNHDLWRVALATGERERLTDNPAADGSPRYSPDGRWLAYRAQARPGFEADRWTVWLLDRLSGERRALTPGWDRSVDNLTWSADSRSLFLEAQDEGRKPIFRVPVEGGTPERVWGDGVNGDLSVAGGRLAFVHQRMTAPGEIHLLDLGTGKAAPVTSVNRDRVQGWDLPTPESVVIPGEGGTPVQMWILRPPGFEPGRRYPLVFWVHGGPQSAFLDSWSTRWNPQVWAAQGYVVALPNPRGSTGFGQAFTDQISHDWGGRVFEDLMACIRYLEAQPYVDPARMAAAGASYGGYMMNWFQGHTDKFRTLVNHCGVYNFQSMYGTTEEVWFDEWDHGIPWESAEYERFSPHRFAAAFKTPMLIIHNDLDFRVPISEGMQVFTVLQRKGVHSRLVMFPDEGHWVLKPKNSEFWHQTIFEWLDGYLRK